jgi:hypothetical protein
MDRLFERIQNKPGIWEGADPPADDLAGVSVDDESGMDEPFPGCHIGEAARHCPWTNRGQWLDH